MVYGQKEEAFLKITEYCIQQIKNVKLKGLSWFLTRKKLQRIINKLYHEKEIDLVEAPDWTGITSFISPKKCPIVIRLNGSDTYFCHLDNRPVKWINKFHEKRALQNADALLSVSQFTADVTNQLFGLERNLQLFLIALILTYLSVIIIIIIIIIIKSYLYFGSLIRKKGLLELPLIFNEVIKTNPDAKLVLVGRMFLILFQEMHRLGE